MSNSRTYSTAMLTTPCHLTGETVVRLMRRHRKTIRGLAASMAITQTRVRHVRVTGVHGAAYVLDWLEAITGDSHAGWCAVARAYL